MGKHTARRVSEQNLVRYYGFKAPAAPQQVYFDQPVITRQEPRTVTAASGLGDVFVGSIALAFGLIVVVVKITSWCVRGVAKFIRWIGREV